MSKESVATQETLWQKIAKVIYTIVPIQKYEWKKFLPMSLLMFCILFIYTTLRSLKDTLVAREAVCGATECLSFMKLLVPFAAIIFMFVFNLLCNKFDTKKIFYIIIVSFVTFYVCFLLVIYPNANRLHMSESTIIGLQNSIPALKWLWPIIGNWTFSLFYIMADLWNYVVYQLLFWQFANQITKLSEAKRFYALFGLIGNTSPIVGGFLFFFLSQHLLQGTKAFYPSLRLQITEVAVASIVLLIIYTWIHRKVLVDPKLYSPKLSAKNNPKKKVKMSIGESLKYIFTSKYLLLIAVLIIGYGTSFNLIECVWKKQVELMFPASGQFNRMLILKDTLTGICTVTVTLLLNSLLRKCKWRTCALITPVIFLAFGSVLIGTTMYVKHSGPNAVAFGINILSISVFLGLGLIAASKGLKYSMFDSTKNMAYIPLDPEIKVRGQAAVESVGGSFGKAGSALIQQMLLAFAGAGSSIIGLIGIIGPIAIFVIIAWICAVFGLSKKYERLLAQREREDAELELAKKEVKEEVMTK